MPAKKPSDTHKNKLVNGDYAAARNIVGYCHIQTHRGYLTKALVVKHDCLTKHCPFLEKFACGFWTQRRGISKEEKAQIKAERKEAKRLEQERLQCVKDTLETSGHIYVTSVKEEEAGKLLVINYIYDKKQDLTAEVKALKALLGRTIKLQARRGSYDAVETLIRKRREAVKENDWRAAERYTQPFV